MVIFQKLRWQAILGLVSLAMGLAQAGAAQSVVGTTIIEGRDVQLLSNNTWRFTETTGLEEGCTIIDGNLSFCGAPTRWQRAPVTPAPAIDALFQVDDRNFGMLIVEGLGRADGLTEENLREAVLLNAGAAAGLVRQAVPVIDTFESTVGDKSYPTIAYQIELQGLPFTYLTTLVVEERSAAQLTTYAIGEAITDGQRALHTEFLSLVRLGE